MLISNRHKFIFIHVPKVAGQSVTSALQPFCASTVQHLLSGVLSYQLQFKINTKLKQRFGFKIGRLQWEDHITMSELIQSMGSSVDGYFSFAFVRNPWDWVLSNYKYAMKNPRHHRHAFVKYQCVDFDDYVIRLYGDQASKDYSQSNFICDKEDRVLVDYLGRMERLNDDFNYVCDVLGISAKLPQLNTSGGIDYRTFYSERSKCVIQERLRRDIENFGYEF